MRETDYDLQELQMRIDHSVTSAGEFLKQAFQIPDCSLNAEQLAKYLQGLQTVALASVTGDAEPRVAPI